MGSRGALDKGKGKNMGKKINPFTYQRTCRIQIVTVRGMGRSQDWLSLLDSNTICLLRGPTKAQLKKLQFVIVINNLFIIRDYQCRLSHDVVTSNVDGDVRLHTVSLLEAMRCIMLCGICCWKIQSGRKLCYADIFTRHTNGENSRQTSTLSSFSSKSVPLSSSIFKWIGERFESFLTSALPSKNVRKTFQPYETTEKRLE